LIVGGRGEKEVDGEEGEVVVKEADVEKGSSGTGSEKTETKTTPKE
jgi:hypothetical protein